MRLFWKSIFAAIGLKRQQKKNKKNTEEEM